MMKRISGFLTLLLALIMVLAACGTGGGNEPAATAESSAPSSNAVSSTAPEEKGPPTELTMMFITMGSPPSDIALVEEAASKILTEKINVKLKLQPVNIGAYAQQQNLVLSSGEKVDLLMTFPFTYLALVAQGSIQEIGPLLDKYGTGVKDALGKFLQGSVVNGKIYGVRPISDLAGGGGLVIRKDIVDKYNIDLTAVKSFADIGNVLKIIKEKEPNFNPLTYNGINQGLLELEIQYEFDKLNDYFGVLPFDSQDMKVINIFESQWYSDNVKMMRDWYLKGYIMKDVATATEDQRQLVKAGKAYAYTSPTKPDIAVQESSQIGMDMYVHEYFKPTSSTSNITLFQWVMPNACKTPDKAVQLLNEMYTNAELENILAWGIEGKHYEKKPDGTIGFPAGVDMNNSGYFLSTPWMMGNAFLTHVWTGNAFDTWEKTKEFNDSATISKAMGFSYDVEPVKTEFAALSNVYNQYKRTLESGTVDPDKMLPQFLSKLKSAGIDKVIAEKQKQLDEWIKVNNIK